MKWWTSFILALGRKQTQVAESNSSTIFYEGPQNIQHFSPNTINQQKIRKGSCHKPLISFPCSMDDIPFVLDYS